MTSDVWPAKKWLKEVKEFYKNEFECVCVAFIIDETYKNIGFSCIWTFRKFLFLLWRGQTYYLIETAEMKIYLGSKI